MSYDKNLLKNLFVKLLDDKLKRLEKRNIEEIKDLNYAKVEYKKQNIILDQLIKKKLSVKINSNRKVSFNDSFSSKPDSIKCKLSQNSNKFKLSPKYYRKNNNLRRALTPSKPNSKYYKTSDNWMTKKRNNKYSYVKSRYMDESNYMINSNYKTIKEDRKIFLTPEPHIIKRKKKNINRDKINIVPKKINLEKIEIKEKRNVNSLKIPNKSKINRMISDIDLKSDEIDFVLNELKKERERKNYEGEEEENENEDNTSQNKNNNSNSSSESNYLNNEQINFGKFINSSDGDNIVKLISSFLDKETKYNFFSCSKKLINNLRLELKNIYNNILDMNKKETIDSLNDEINNIKNKYKGEDFESTKYSFKLSKGSIKAIELLDNENYNDIFKTEELKPPLDNIILIYRIYFQLINKEELIEIVSNKIFWENTRNYFLENSGGKIGSFIKEYISEFDFTNRNIYILKKLIKGNESKLKPINIENICKTTGLLAFIMKDALEYCGVIFNEKKMMPGIIISYLEYIKENLNECKEYIDILKAYK